MFAHLRILKVRPLSCFGAVLAISAVLSTIPRAAGNWVRQIGTSGSDSGLGLTIDQIGNVYISGSTEGSLVGQNAGLHDAFVTKFDADGSLLWTQQLGTIDNDNAEGVSSDALGNIYISGTTYGSLGGPNAGEEDAYVAKYNSNGSHQWTRQLGTNVADGGTDVSADGLGNVYISGYTRGGLGGPNPDGSYDAFVAKYGSDGSLKWTRQLVDTTWGEAVAADGVGNVYISGFNRQTYNAFVAKYDANGSLLWTRQFGTSSDEEQAKGVAVDGLGNVYISGVVDIPGPTGYIPSDAFVAKYDAAGNFQWSHQFGTTDFDHSWSVAADGLGNAYVAGSTGHNLGRLNDAFVAKYDADGSQQWFHKLGSTGSVEDSKSVATDGLGNIFLAGSTDGSFAGSSAGSFDAFVTKFSESSIPEPSTLLLAGLAVVPIVLKRRGRGQCVRTQARKLRTIYLLIAIFGTTRRCGNAGRTALQAHGL